MKRALEWAAYAVGALAVIYIALYLYAMFARPEIEPGDPIRIFRKPDAPNYSALMPTLQQAGIRRRRQG
jgi:hypothetical protein